MKRYVFDIETNGFLEDTTTVHCLVIKDVDTGEVTSAHNHAPGEEDVDYVGEALTKLATADEIIGHNIIAFDLPAIKKVYPSFSTKAKLFDTLVVARVLWTDIKQGDFRRAERGQLPKNLIGKHTLEAYGYRLGILKGTYDGPWDQWSQIMQDYCVQDVAVTEALYLKEQKEVDAHSDTDWLELEHDVRRIIFRQEQRGVAFDVQAAGQLYAQLIAKREQLSAELKSAFAPWWRRKPGKDSYMTPKRDNRRMGYVAGASFTKVELHEFNAASREDVADRLMKVRGWQPTAYGKDGVPTIDDEILAKLDFPEAPKLSELFMVAKRIGALAEGKEALLKHEKNGVIHGAVLTNGAVTGRMIHFHPNLAQTPRVGTPYGKEFRSLFRARKGYLLVGCDASSLEGCCLAGYMAKHDGGAYIEVVTKGDKKLGTDNHSVNARALELDPTKEYPFDGKTKSGRDISKTWFYAMVYGSGDYNLGIESGFRGSRAATTNEGKRLRAKVMKNLPALKKIIDAVNERVATRGYIVGLDGRRLRIRKSHAALNVLLQSAGAIIMKRALVILDNRLQDMGLTPGVEYEMVLNIHDEVQMEVLNKDGLPETVGKMAEQAITDAGIYYDFKCPLAGSSDIGETWAATH